MARISTAQLDAMIQLCQIKIDTLTDAAAPRYYKGTDDKKVGQVIHLRKLIYTMQIGANLSDKKLEVVYQEALDKSGAYNTPVSTSTLNLNSI